MFLFVVGIAAAAEFVVVPAEEPLRPRIPTLVYVSSSYGGLTSGQAPSVRVEGGTVRLSDRVTAPGVWPYLVTADGAEAQLVLEVEAFGRGHRSVLEVGVVPEQRFEIPQRTEGIAQGTPIRIELGGLNPPAVGELDVVVSEGTYELVEEAGRPVLVVTPDASPFPRTLSVGLRDRGGASAPVWGEIRLRARPRIPVTAEPGATLDLEVGGREYGPFKADARGVIEARIDQYPGERVARATLQDDLGNTNESTIPLSVSDQSVLIAIEGERRSPSEPPRMVYLHAVDASGRPAKQPPTCRSPAVGTFELVTLEPGSFLLPIEGLFPNERQGVRVDCALDDTGLALRLGGREGAPARISLQVWPTELSTDFPVAEVRVSLEDEVGNRLPVEDVQVGAELGTVELRFEGNAALGEYEGAGAVEAGVDTIEATFAPRAVTGAPSALALVWSAIPESGRARVRVFARDGLARPVRDASLTISAGSDPVDVRTDEQGWAEADVRVPGGTAPVVLSARGDRAVVRELATRGSERTTPVGTGTLVARRTVNLAPGRVSGINVRVEPPVLSTGRNAVAWIQVRLEDRAGQPVLDEPVQIVASEGTVGPVVANADGTWVAEFTPARGDRAREVEIEVSSSSLRSTAALPLEPRLGRLTIGPLLGWVTNFGALSSPAIGFDADIRLRLLGGSVMLRGGVMGYGLSGKAETGIGEEASINSTVIPGMLALLLRQDRGGFGFWGGAGGLLGVQTIRGRFGQDVVSQGVRTVSGGGLIGGAGYRLGAGDLVTEIRWTWLPGTGGDLGFTGNLGGLSAGFGYRFVY